MLINPTKKFMYAEALYKTMMDNSEYSDEYAARVFAGGITSVYTKANGSMSMYKEVLSYLTVAKHIRKYTGTNPVVYVLGSKPTLDSYRQYLNDTVGGVKKEVIGNTTAARTNVKITNLTAEFLKLQSELANIKSLLVTIIDHHNSGQKIHMGDPSSLMYDYVAPVDKMTLEEIYESGISSIESENALLGVQADVSEDNVSLPELNEDEEDTYVFESDQPWNE